MVQRHVRESRERVQAQERLVNRLAESGSATLAMASQSLQSMRQFQLIAEEHSEQVLRAEDG